MLAAIEGRPTGVDPVESPVALRLRSFGVATGVEPAAAALHPDLRTLSDADAPALEELHRDCPLSVEGDVRILRTPTFFAWPQAVFREFTYEGIFVGRQLEASLAGGRFDVLTPAGPARALYLFDARTRRKARGKQLTELLAFRLVAQRAAACDLALVVRRLDNAAAARCVRMTSPVPGTVSLLRPLSVLTLPPCGVAARGVRETGRADFPHSPVLGRPAGDLAGLPFRTFVGPDGTAALIGDTATARSREGRQGPAPLDVRALSFDDPIAAATLLHSIGNLVGRPVRIALGAHHGLARTLAATASGRVECELRLIVRKERLADFDNLSASFLLDASLV